MKKPWLKYATESGYSAIGQLPPCRSRIGRSTRMVYVYPGRYCACEACFAETDDEIF